MLVYPLMIWLLVAGILLWLGLRKRRPTAYELRSQAREARIENEALAKHRYDDNSARSRQDYLVNSIEFDFRTMTAVEETLSRFSGPSEYRDHSLRRVDASNWQMQRTPESIALEVDELRASSRREPDETEGNDELIELLQRPQKWMDVPNAAVGPLETQYQRFLIHWRRPSE